mmetsp:Transcript_123360/g.356557  ORF Transcript_123360/g.356557 Transcript_123360/m.356557 type:complete len:247 (+) Transcript_123360:539-1279(+)
MLARIYSNSTRVHDARANSGMCDCMGTRLSHLQLDCIFRPEPLEGAHHNVLLVLPAIIRLQWLAVLEPHIFQDRGFLVSRYWRHHGALCVRLRLVRVRLLVCVPVDRSFELGVGRIVLVRSSDIHGEHGDCDAVGLGGPFLRYLHRGRSRAFGALFQAQLVDRKNFAAALGGERRYSSSAAMLGSKVANSPRARRVVAAMWWNRTLRREEGGLCSAAARRCGPGARGAGGCAEEVAHHRRTLLELD